MKALCFILFAAIVVCVYSENPLKPQCPEDIDEHNMMIRHPCKCNAYFNCATDPPTPMACPSGLQFNVEKQVCDFNWRVKCHPNPACPK